MTDPHTPEQRRYNMSRIGGKNTKPELIVRRLLHRMGYRFRLHRRDLLGSPDIVLPKHGVVIFVHGCFWHRHGCKEGQVMPATRTDFWMRKFEQNMARDRRANRKLRALGWRVITVWECQTKPMKRESLAKRLEKFIG